MAIDNYARETSGDLRLMLPWSLVSVPLVLSAGKELELVRGDELPIREAMKVWHFADEGVAETVSRWWADQADSMDPMPARLKRLDQMLPERVTPVHVDDEV